jgi:DNA-binding NarL/FixJ family response regulator
MIRVLVVDDHLLFRQGLSLLLSQAKDIQIIGEARDGQEAVELAQRLNPDVILMDIEMPRVNGLRATEQLTTSKHPARILILSMKEAEQDVRAAAQSGAQGYLIKNCSREELIKAIRSVYEGRLAISPEIASYFQRKAIGDGSR